MTTAMSRYSIPELKDLPDDIRTQIVKVQEKAGFIPNVFISLARRHDEFRAFFAYYDALMLKENALSKAEKEMIVVATSGANNCVYCVVSHSAMLRIYSKHPLLADQIAINHHKADLTPRQHAMLDFAMKVATESYKIADADFVNLRGHGFNDEDVWDIGAIAAFFALSNRMANLTSMMPNTEFYSMGRMPHSKA